MTPRASRCLALSALALLAAGCQGWPSARRLEECRNRSHALQAEMAQLKDETLQLRQRNRELARRAVEDQDRIQALESGGSETQRSALALQREREELAQAFAELRQQVQAASSPPVRAGRESHSTTR